MPIDRKKLREVIEELDKASPTTAAEIVQKLKGLGAERGIHVGRINLSEEETVEWYAGQGLDILEDEAWFAVNSYINCLDKFVPLKKEEGQHGN